MRGDVEVRAKDKDQIHTELVKSISEALLDLQIRYGNNCLRKIVLKLRDGQESPKDEIYNERPLTSRITSRA
ncbi:hypothetical protein TNIN_26121 [Trichonephila inaurata madagascariensis]|nr:hypothetical protein TNIN_26121 [Trichonephila inaurata madagascariensis]